jgi:Flp pilus assembly pilin Flp
MRNTFLKLYVKAQLLRDALKDESGQDTIEYVMVCAIVIAGLTAASVPLQTMLSSGFSTLSTRLNGAI